MTSLPRPALNLRINTSPTPDHATTPEHLRLPPTSPLSANVTFSEPTGNGVSQNNALDGDGGVSQPPLPPPLPAVPSVPPSSTEHRRSNSRFYDKIQSYVERFNKRHITYYRAHLAWFITVNFIGSIIIHLTNPGHAYIDSLYWSSTAMFVVGLAPGDIESLSRPSQVTMFFLAILGSPIFMSVVPVMIRSRAFKKVLRKEFGVTRTGRIRRRNGPATFVNTDTPDSDVDVPPSSSSVGIGLHRTLTEDVEDASVWEEFQPDVDADAEEKGEVQSTLSGEHAVDLRPRITESPKSVSPEEIPAEGTCDSYVGAKSDNTLGRRVHGNGDRMVDDVITHGLPLQRVGTTRTEDRNSRTQSMLVPDKYVLEQVGGVEYRALKALQSIIICYYFGFILLSILIYRIYLFLSPDASATVSKTVSPWWFSAWMGVSGFNQMGITLLNAGASPFGQSLFFMVYLSLAILLGNTAFPVMMRVIVMALERVYRRDVGRARVYRYLLRYSRRCFTHLFDRTQTLWLVGALVALNVLQYVCSVGLDAHDPAFAGVDHFVHFFQSVATRNAGFQ
ncbi:hypothetical protein HK104_003836, partial [Borealophlyctis nickersoniae]